MTEHTNSDGLERVAKQCSRHGAYEARVIKFLDKEITGACPECTKEAEEREELMKRRVEAESTARRTQALLQRAGIPPRFKDCSLANYVADNEGQKNALSKARWFVDTIKDRVAEGTGMIFTGQAGTGKTHLSTAIANAIIPLGYSAVFITASDAMRSIKRTYDPSSTMTESDAIDALVAPSLLILDEIGMQNRTDHEKQLMFEIINKRYERVKPTILLSNLSSADLKEFLGERIMDRMRQGGGRMIGFEWDSFRK